jgi:hypothetical protein
MGLGVAACGALNGCGEEADAGSGDAAADGESVGCDEERAKPLLATCIVPDAVSGLPAQTSGEPRLDIVETVVELGAGAPPAECFSAYDVTLGRESVPESGELTAARWIRASTAGGLETVIGAIAPSLEWPVAVGDEVSIAYRRSGSTFEPKRGRLELRGSDGELLVWMGFAGSVDELEQPPELVLAQGPEVCRLHSQCVPTWTQHDLSVQLGEEMRVVGYGEQVRMGGYEVTHGGVDVQQPSGGGTSCADAYVAWAAVGVWRTR